MIRLLALVAFLFTIASPAHPGALIVLQHQPGDASRPWTWRMIIEHLPMIRDAGYTAILLSPHEQACGGDQSLGYDPYDFRSFDSAHGTEQELADLIRKAHALQLQVYADMVLNHMCSNHNFTYPRFSKPDFHTFGEIKTEDQWQLENGSLSGLEDLSQESPYVRGELWDFLVKTNNMGFDGYRWDAAKHMPRWYWKEHILPNVKSWGKYSFGEVVSGAVGYLSSYIDTGMAVTDYALYFVMRDNFKFGGNLAALDGAGVAGVNGPNALTFVENHDDPNPPVNKLLAYAFIAAYPGYPAFFKVDLQDAAINNLVWVQNTLAAGPYVNRYKEGDTIIFTRGDRLLAGVNQRGDGVSQWVATPWVNTKIHDYTGHVQDEETNADGWVELRIPPQSYVMMAPLR